MEEIKKDKNKQINKDVTREYLGFCTQVVFNIYYNLLTSCGLLLDSV